MESFKGENEFFERIETYADYVKIASETVKLGDKSSKDYWNAMAILCKEKARRLR